MFAAMWDNIETFSPGSKPFKAVQVKQEFCTGNLADVLK